MCLTNMFNRLKLEKIWAEEHPRVFLWSPVAIGLGIGAYFSWPTEPELKTALIASFLTTLIMLFTHYFRTYIALFPSLFSLFTKSVFLITLGFTLSIAASKFYGTPMLDKPMGPVIVSANIADVEQRGLGRRLLLENLKIRKLKSKKDTSEDIEPNEIPQNQTPRKIHLVLNERLSNQTGDLEPGQRISVIAQLMPLSEPMSPEGFDFRRNNFFKGIGATGYITSKVRIYDKEKTSFDPNVWFAQLRKSIQAEVRKTLQGDDAGLAIILLTGDKSSLSEESATAIRAVGLAHLLAISGLHIGLVAGIVFFLIRALLALSTTLTLRFHIKKWAAFIASLAAIFYTLQVGAPVSTKRSLIMACIVLLGVMFDRLSISLRTIMVAALIILVFWPQMLLHPSFQLSFAAVMGLISVGEWNRIRGWKPFKNRAGLAWTALRHLVNLGVMSFVATIATLPFSLFHFQEAGIYSMLANTLAIPLTSIWLMPLCVFVYFLWPFGLAEYPLLILKPGTSLLIRLSKSIASLPGAFFNPPQMPAHLLVIATCGGLVFCLMTVRRRWLGLGIMITAITTSFFSPRPNIIINPEGDQVGWHGTESSELLITSTGKPDKFLAKYWRSTVGVTENSIRFIEDTEESPPLSCNPEKCVFIADKTIALIKDPAALQSECGKNYAVIINPANDEVCANSDKKFITKETLNNNGAHAIYFDKNILDIRTSRTAPALRPWSVGWHK